MNTILKEPADSDTPSIYGGTPGQYESTANLIGETKEALEFRLAKQTMNEVGDQLEEMTEEDFLQELTLSLINRTKEFPYQFSPEGTITVELFDKYHAFQKVAVACNGDDSLQLTSQHAPKLESFDEDYEPNNSVQVLLQAQGGNYVLSGVTVNYVSPNGERNKYDLAQLDGYGLDSHSRLALLKFAQHELNWMINTVYDHATTIYEDVEEISLVGGSLRDKLVEVAENRNLNGLNPEQVKLAHEIQDLVKKIEPASVVEFVKSKTADTNPTHEEIDSNSSLSLLRREQDGEETLSEIFLGTTLEDDTRFTLDVECVETTPMNLSFTMRGPKRAVSPIHWGAILDIENGKIRISHRYVTKEQITPLLEQTLDAVGQIEKLIQSPEA
jgi:hypothetical protein